MCIIYTIINNTYYNLFFESGVFFVCIGSSMTTVLLQVSHGKRPCMEMFPERKPHECDQMINIMKQCWDQDPRKRPQFLGTNVSLLSWIVFRQLSNLHLKLSKELQLLWSSTDLTELQSCLDRKKELPAQMHWDEKEQYY